MPHTPTSQHLQGTTELTVLMPVKTGLVDALEPMTYATRLRRLMMALNGLRQSSREKSALRPLSDTVERIETIQSFRLALLDNDTRLLLAVSFDGPWEPYIRKVWYDLGPLLDIIVCNCEDYPLAFNHSFHEYAAWIRRYQVDAQFFYTASDLTPADVFYLRSSERIQRENPDPISRDQQLTRLYVPEPEQRATDVGAVRVDLLLEQGLTALNVLDSLRELYPDNTEDGDILLRASHELLLELKRFDTLQIPEPLRTLNQSQLLWFEQPRQPRPRPPLEDVALDYRDIQGGILTRYENIKTGALLLFRITHLKKARRIIARLPISCEAGGSEHGIHYNIAFTLNGLRQLQVDDSDLQGFPAEFLQGMESRAGLLGDERDHHPSRWRLPKQNWDNTGASREVPLSNVDFVVQLRTTKTCNTDPHRIIDNQDHPLFDTVKALAGKAGTELLAVEAMLSYERGHFGFVDGISQPVLDSDASQQYWSDVVAPGEILLGHQTDRDLLSAEQSVVDPLFENGTFMVIRKIQQNVEVLDEFLDQQKAVLDQHAMDKDDLKALMMGRRPDGTPLVTHNGDNDFNFEDDREGIRCPMQSHIRRSNPRHPALGEPPEKMPVPRIVRRGMSYGPGFAADGEPRGLMFIAYNASIANQFEVLQNWITGANSSNTYSGLADPILGVPQPGEKRTFRCLSPQGDVLRFDIDKSETDARPLTQLQWGMYLFVPSISTIKRLVNPPQLQGHCDVETGEAWITKLQALEKYKGAEVALEAWNTVLDDASASATGITAAIWSAIRKNHGALRTPYGVLVGLQDLADQVLADDQTFSVSGYAERMQASLGDIYLGLDSGKRYERASAVSNKAIMKVSEKKGFDSALKFTRARLTQLKAVASAFGKAETTISLRWLIDSVLADLSHYWFDLPDGEHIHAGGKPAPGEDTLHCPFHFTPPSRYIFSPNPSEFAIEAGEVAGSRLTEKALLFVKAQRDNPEAIKGAISKPMFAGIDDDETLAQNLVGALMGFLPTAMGLFLKTFYQWMQDGTLQRLQQEFHQHIKSTNHSDCAHILKEPMATAIQRAPVPYMIWRTTTRPCTLAGINLHETSNGRATPDRIVIGITSLTQESLERDKQEVCPVFGGDRQQKHHPTHACPGRAMAMGVLSGVTSALLESGVLCNSGIPLTLTTNTAG